MPIEIPNLDDRNFDQLLNETASIIERYFPEYTEIGPSDPAVAINELFCFLFDVAGYQLNRITPGARNNFAALLGTGSDYGRPPEEALRRALSKISRIERAVTPGDIETIIKRASADGKLCSAPVERVFVRLSPGKPVRIFIYQEEVRAAQREKNIRNLYSYLRRRSPLGTRLYITHANMHSIDIAAEMVKRRDSTVSSDKLAAEARSKLQSFFHPLRGGDEGRGWEFGKAVSRGDVYALLEGISGVDHVRSLYLKNSEENNYSSRDILPLDEGNLVDLHNISILVR